MIAFDPVIGHVIGLALAALFLSSCVHKIRAPREFSAALRDYRILPETMVELTGTVLIAIEALAGATALVAGTRPCALLLMLGLLCLYTAAIGINLLRGRRDIDCGCAGVARGQPLSPGLVVRNVILIALCLMALAPTTGRPVDGPDRVTIVMGAAFLVLLYTAGAQLIANRPRLAALRGPHV